MQEPTQPQIQDALLDVPVSSLASRPVSVPGVEKPVARVVLDSLVPHLDRLFDYQIPAELDHSAQVGTRVTVRFGASEVHGWIWERTDTTSHQGSLLPVRRVVSDLVVVPERSRRLIDALAERTAGTRADLLRLAIPPRHVSTERSEREADMPPVPHYEAVPVESTGWGAYEGGEQFISAVAQGQAPRCVWGVLPAREGLTKDWVELLAQAIQTTRALGRAALIIVPTTAQAQQIAAKLHALLGGEKIGLLCPEHGQARRYRTFVAALLGHIGVVVGTRAAAFTPLRDLGLAVVWDDGDSRLVEQHAPYIHARSVLAMRSSLEGAAFLMAGYARSVEAHSYVAQGWAGELMAPRALLRQVLPRIEVPGAPELDAEGASGYSRIPSRAHALIRRALQQGPVLVQVPRAGYAPSVACASCGERARCPRCSGPLELTPLTPASGVWGSAHPAPSQPTSAAPSLLGGARQLLCRWCAMRTSQWTCRACGAHELRMIGVGSARTGEELGRAFPGVPVVVSGAREHHGVIESVDDQPRLVVSTPGAEPVALGGYRAVVILDAAALSARAQLGASVGALRRWAGAVVLACANGQVMVVGNPGQAVAQALIRWDHAGFARRELAERAELRLPPAVRCARIDGSLAALEALSEQAQQAGWDTLGPVSVREQAAAASRVEGSTTTNPSRQDSAHLRHEIGTHEARAPRSASAIEAQRATGNGAQTPTDAAGSLHKYPARLLIRVPLSQGRELAHWLRVRSRERSAKREEPVRIELDPQQLW